jgi:accessory gene regulator B
MIGNLSKNLSLKLYKRKFISENDIELISYGLFLLFSYAIYALLCLACGIIFHCVVESIIFYFSFSIIRMFTGGFHASSESKCFLISSIMIFLSMITVIILERYQIAIVFFIMLLISSVLIVVFSPLDNENKKLDRQEKAKFHKTAIAILILFIALILIFFKLNKPISFSIGISIIVEGIFIAFEKIRAVIQAKHS